MENILSSRGENFIITKRMFSHRDENKFDRENYCQTYLRPDKGRRK